MKEALQRRKIGPTRLSVSGLYCFRGERMIAYESTLERDLLRKFAFSHRVMTVETQPLTIEWRDPAGYSRRYTPDALVHWRWMGEYWRNRDVPWLIEVKPRSEIRKRWTRWHAKFRMAYRYAAERGWRFRIFDEARIRDVVFHNAVVLERFSRPIDRVDGEAILEDIRRSGIGSVKNLVARHSPSAGDREIVLQAVWRLIATGFAECDLTKPLGIETEVWIPNYGD